MAEAVGPRRGVIRNESMSRGDVEGLIGVNGGTAVGLDLSSRSLRSANLSEMNLREGRFRAADLGRTDFREADVFRADFRGAFLMQSDLQGAYLLAVRIDEHTNLEDINWGYNYINEWEQIGSYQNARANYRQLNTWHQHHGHSDIAGEFLYREWVCKRLEAQEQLSSALSWRHPWRTLRALNWR